MQTHDFTPAGHDVMATTRKARLLALSQEQYENELSAIVTELNSFTAQADAAINAATTAHKVRQVLILAIP